MDRAPQASCHRTEGRPRTACSRARSADQGAHVLLPDSCRHAPLELPSLHEYVRSLTEQCMALTVRSSHVQQPGHTLPLHIMTGCWQASCSAACEGLPKDLVVQQCASPMRQPSRLCCTLLVRLGMHCKHSTSRHSLLSPLPSFQKLWSIRACCCADLESVKLPGVQETAKEAAKDAQQDSSTFLEAAQPPVSEAEGLVDGQAAPLPSSAAPPGGYISVNTCRSLCLA